MTDLLDVGLTFDAGHRIFSDGEVVIEDVLVNKGQVRFLEEHYFNLMASMRILRMDIPDSFTPENFRSQIEGSLTTKELLDEKLILRYAVFRNVLDFGAQLVKSQIGSTIIRHRNNLEPHGNKHGYRVELYKDNLIAANLVSTVHTNNRYIHSLAKIFAHENGFDDCILLNQDKQVIGTTTGNLFLVSSNEIVTAPLLDGAPNTVIKKKLVDLIRQLDGYSVQERSINPFELQKADGIFISDLKVGTKPITQYRKKSYSSMVSEMINKKYEELIQAGLSSM